MALLALRNGYYWLVKRPLLLDEVGAFENLDDYACCRIMADEQA